MKHIKSFSVFESSSSSKLTSEMIDLLNSMMSEINVEIETDKDKMLDWILEKALEIAAEEYLDSEDFREFSEASVEETDEYMERVEAGEDPNEVLLDLTDQAIEDKTYWNEFLDSGYLSDITNDIRNGVNYTDPDDSSYLTSIDSTWKESFGSDFPNVDIQGTAELFGYSESFLPFRVRSISFIETDQELDLNLKFQKSYETGNPSGQFIISRTNLVALDKGPIEAEFGFAIYENSRLISIEGIKDFESLDIDRNFLDSQTLKKSIGLTPGSEQSHQYYLSLLELPEASNFDEEQIQFIVDRIGNIQELIDKTPEKMAVLLKPIWKKLKKSDKYKNLIFPKELSDEMDLLSDLHDIGI
jgi:hypothetical protein